MMAIVRAKVELSGPTNLRCCGRTNPDLIGDAVEEFLRYDSAAHQTRRITLAPCPIGGREIPAGAMLIACLGSVDRDDRVFGPDADVLRLDREQSRLHVSFSAVPQYGLRR